MSSSFKYMYIDRILQIRIGMVVCMKKKYSFDRDFISHSFLVFVLKLLSTCFLPGLISNSTSEETTVLDKIQKVC